MYTNQRCLALSFITFDLNVVQSNIFISFSILLDEFSGDMIFDYFELIFFANFIWLILMFNNEHFFLFLHHSNRLPTIPFDIFNFVFKLLHPRSQNRFLTHLDLLDTWYHSFFIIRLFVNSDNTRFQSALFLGQFRYVRVFILDVILAFSFFIMQIHLNMIVLHSYKITVVNGTSVNRCAVYFHRVSTKRLHSWKTVSRLRSSLNLLLRVLAHKKISLE